MVTHHKPVRRHRSGWKTADAKANLSAVLAAAAREPQIIHRHARPVAVVLAYQEYSRLIGREAAATPVPTVAQTLAELRPLLASETEPLPLPLRSSRPLPPALRAKS